MKKGFVVVIFLFYVTCINIQAQTSNSTYEIGTWRGFSTAAVTYTFDDQCPKQFTVAVPLLEKYGFKATFYPTISQGTDWVNLRKLVNNGHEIGSHAMTHTSLKGLSNEEAELKNSKTEIEKQIPENRCLTIAYPYCDVGTESLVSKYYIAGRACQGQIETKKPSLFNISSIALGNETSLNSVKTINAKVNEAITTKGWCVFLIHGIDDDGGYSPLASSVLDSNFAYVKENEGTFWVSTFSNVVKYIKERDAATVHEISVQDQSIKLSVTDNLADSIYNFPLTIRRILPSRWSSASVVQNGVHVKSSIVTVGSTSYVMFDAIPDNGEIVISPENAAANSIVSKYGALRRVGSKIVGASGNPVQVAGLSLYWSIWGGEKFYNSNVVTKVATSWNATLIRAAIAVEFTGGYLENPMQQLAYAKAVVDAAIANGIYVLVDWHDHNANLHIPQAKEFFSAMSETYRNTPNVIWEIWNEPDNENGTGADGIDSWDDIKNYADSIIPVIRKNSSNLIVCGTPNWSSDPASAANKPLSDINVAYTLHFYSGTHGASVKANAETALSKGVAVFISEFGTVNTTNIKTDTTLFLDEAKSWLDWADAKGLSWANWSLSDIPEACSELISSASSSGSWSDSDLSRSGKWVRDRLLARSTGESSDSAKIYTFVNGSGSITVSPNVKIVKKGTEATFTAMAAEGWEFKSWSDGSASTNNPLTLKIDENTSLVAIFVPDASTNMVKSGDFSDKSQWNFWVDEKDNAATISYTDEQANVVITKADTINWKIQLSQTGFVLDSGLTLVLTFDAWSSTERKLFAGLSSAVTYHYQGGGEVLLSDKKKTFTIEMTPDSSTNAGILSFSCGNSILPVYIDNVIMVKKYSSAVKMTNARYNTFASIKQIGDFLYWTPVSTNDKVILTDISGRIISPETKGNSISLAKCSRGMYLLVVTDGIKKQVFQILRK